jgi:alkanesulfonate monooxygenase SsuD/methylene tetrahydromethanopterin reductase-like flavin-dependent oxidoreductase (luciferase family)
VQFGVTYHMRNPPAWRVPFPEFYESQISHMCRMEELGFDGVWIQQHHFEESAYGPSFAAIAGTLSSRTTRIRVGSDIEILPLRHPLLVAEEMAVIDNLLHGRLDVGIGMGHRQLEFEVLGIPVSQRPSRIEEGVDILRRAWTEDPVTFHGRRYSFDDIPLQPKPVQRPHPPIWMASRAIPSAQRAARQRCHLHTSSGTPAEVYATYFQGLADQGEDPRQYHAVKGLTVVVTEETPERVWARYEPYAAYHFGFHEKVIAERNDPPLRLESDFHLFGRPAELIERIATLQAADAWGGFSWDTLKLHAPLPGIPADESHESFARFAAEVMPALRAL